MVARVTEALDRAREDSEIRALLLRIDSPGGTVTATDQIHSEILRFKQEKEVSVGAQLQSTATSGGYYVAMAADVVQAHPTTLTGSIGVLYTNVSFAGLMEKLGIEDQTITAGEQKDAGSPLRRLRPEERAQLQSVVDDLHARFRMIVEQGRPELPADRVRELADGRVFSARQALENGLVDRIGTLREAVRVLEGRLGVSESRVVRYHRPREIRRNLYSQAPGLSSWIAPGGDRATEIAGSIALRRLDGILSRPGFLYLWWPATAR
jgi:protease-4